MGSNAHLSFFCDRFRIAMLVRDVQTDPSETQCNCVCSRIPECITLHQSYLREFGRNCFKDKHWGTLDLRDGMQHIWVIQSRLGYHHELN